MNKKIISAVFAVLVVASFIVHNQVSVPKDEYELWKTKHSV